MSKMSNAEKLVKLNAYRAAEGRGLLSAFRSRCQAELDAYEQAEADREYAKRKADEEAKDAARKAAEAELEANASKGDKPKPVKAPKVKEAKGDKAPSYKAIANYDKSSVESPVAYIHAFLDANPDMGRKAAVVELVRRGINYSTARTQYQRWFNAGRASGALRGKGKAGA